MSAEKPLRRVTQRLPQERRVADILSAARQVIAEKGYENVLMSEIAERAGIVEGTLYRYFESKQDLLTKVADDWFEEVLTTDSALDSIRGTWNRLRHMIWRSLVAIRSQPSLSRFMLLEVRRDPDYRNTRSFELNRRFTTEISELCAGAIASGEFRNDVPIHLLRDLIFGCIEHSTWKFLRGEGDFDVASVADGIATVVVRGMVAERDNPAAGLREVAGRLERATGKIERLLDGK
jgi:AcrR family transcriptional regulator